MALVSIEILPASSSFLHNTIEPLLSCLNPSSLLRQSYDSRCNSVNLVHHLVHLSCLNTVFSTPHGAREVSSWKSKSLSSRFYSIDTILVKISLSPSQRQPWTPAPSATHRMVSQFSTDILPDRSECFNLHEIFAQNSTIRDRNETPSTPVPQTEQGIWWVIHNPESFDPSANYSHIWYQQVYPGGNVGAGRRGERSLSIYNGRDCQQVGDPLQPWLGWSCQTKFGGDCEIVPYSVQSFSINRTDPAPAGDEFDCWSFAYQGSAARISPNK